jgi:hypothetical protein
MAKIVLDKFDRFISYLTISVVVGGGFFIHIITALTIKSYYGSFWGYVSFMLPGFAELYLTIIQVSEQMYNYTIILSAFLTLTAAVGLTWFLKNSVKFKLERVKSN